MRVKVILNPTSDRGRAIEAKTHIQTAGQQYGQLDVAVTERPNHATDLARRAADAGYDMVVAAGGDGTIHEIVNGLVFGDKADTVLGVIPIGSGNDFAFALGISKEIKTAVSRLFTQKPQIIDLARIEDNKGRYTIVNNGIGIGFDATIAVESRNITRLHGFPMYMLATLRTIAFYYNTPRCELHFDDERLTQEILLLAVGVGPRAGGGFLLTPDAKLNDAMLDSCLINPVGRLTMLGMLLKVMKGRHGTHSAVSMRRHRRLVIRANMPLPIHTDGEIFAYPHDDVREVAITSLPAAIRVIA